MQRFRQHPQASGAQHQKCLQRNQHQRGEHAQQRRALLFHHFSGHRSGYHRPPRLTQSAPFRCSSAAPPRSVSLRSCNLLVTCLLLRSTIPSCQPVGPTMLSKSTLLAIAVALAPICTAAQTPALPAAAAVWNALSAPAMDPTKFAHAENVVIARDAIRITLIDGTIQFLQPVNGIVFGAVFHGNGRLEAAPPNPLEAHQLWLFTKQSKLDMAITEATFSFTDTFAEEISKEVKFQA